MLSAAEENYLKAIFKIAEKEGKDASTNAIAGALQTTAASVTDMLKRLSDKSLIVYERYRGVRLTGEGKQIATGLIRKHRLWEVFLVDKLGFAWDEVHDIAEQLEHIRSETLAKRLDMYLGYPRYDPHGDPIPDANGHWTHRPQVLLSTLTPGQQASITGVNEHSPAFLQHLNQLGLGLGTVIEVLERFEYDRTLKVRIADKIQVLSEKVCQNLWVHGT